MSIVWILDLHNTYLILIEFNIFFKKETSFQEIDIITYAIYRFL